MNTTRAQSKPFSNTEISAFCGQLALILKSGISSLEGLTILLEDTTAPEERSVLEAMLETLTATGSLAGALEALALFPSYMVRMVAIGEETGTLDEVMEALSTHYEREDSIAKNIRSAVMYPVIMAVMMIVVIVILLVKVMPIFNQVFVQLGSEMTGVSRLLMQLGNTINRYSVVFLVLILLIIGLLLFGTRTRQGRQFFRGLGYRIGFIRPIYEEIAACRFAGGMALTLSSGLNPERSMELVCALNDDPFFQKKLNVCRAKISEGADLSEALHASGIFTGIYARMASVGGRTGSMDLVMNQIAGLYEQDIDNRMTHSLAVLEPTLVIALSLIVGVILLSVMFPLMGIMSSI